MGPGGEGGKDTREEGGKAEEKGEGAQPCGASETPGSLPLKGLGNRGGENPGDLLCTRGDGSSLT